MTALLRPPASQGRKSGPEYYWRLVKRFGQDGFTVNDLFAKTRGVTRSTVKGYVQILRTTGAVVAIGTSRDPSPAARRATRYAVAKPDLRIAPSGQRETAADRVRGRKQLQLWNGMRLLRDFSVTQLALKASTDVVEVSIPFTRTYVGALAKAGLVVEVQPMSCVSAFRAGFTPAILRLLPSANTGPQPLRIIGSHVFDPNSGKIVGLPLDGSEVSA